MSTSLMPVSSTPGRPSVIIKDGCSHFISVRDQWHRGELKRLKDRMRDLHPDHRWWTLKTLEPKSAAMTDVKYIRYPDATGPFLQAKRQLKWFKAQETSFYRKLGLSLPDKEGQVYEPPPDESQRKMLSGRTGSGVLGGRWNTQRSR